MLEYTAVFVVRNYPPRPLLNISSGFFSSRKLFGFQASMLNAAIITFGLSCRAAFGVPRPLSRSSIGRRCGSHGRAFQLSGLKKTRLR